ncbi:bactofilin family protein [Citrobacter meridianamericanus]|uniref:Polymer-forming cytoskeletal protein n=1 Tax=Citrobacter meridianamericanus TaxID=2894201 RepID=A0ABT1BGR3_9ENTR|nr:polymer-forming cytoskeletal protein [Citrobacter meridianamericanus]MCO5784626.1 polymer-forming cytoskeletal protein [Citrobacter meridianamericanus]
MLANSRRHDGLWFVWLLWAAGLVFITGPHWRAGCGAMTVAVVLSAWLIFVPAVFGENMFNRKIKPSAQACETASPPVPKGGNQVAPGPVIPDPVSSPASVRRCTLLAAGTHVAGDLVVTGDCQVCGHVSGTVTLSDGVLRVMKGGRIDGDVRAPSVTIDGSMQGTCDAEQVEILENGNLDGICRSRQFSIASGGVFTGQSERRAEPALTDKDTEEGLSGTVTDLPSHRAWLTPLASVTDTESGERADG